MLGAHSAPPSQFTVTGLSALNREKTWVACCPCHKLTQTPKHLAHGTTVRSHGRVGSHGTRIAWVQTRMGPGSVGLCVAFGRPA